MNWRRVDDYCIRSGDYRIAKVVVKGVARYECWYGRQLIGSRPDPDAARELCAQHLTPEAA